MWVLIKIVKINKFLFRYDSVEYIYSELKTKMMIPKFSKNVFSFK